MRRPLIAALTALVLLGTAACSDDDGTVDAGPGTDPPGSSEPAPSDPGPGDPVDDAEVLFLGEGFPDDPTEPPSAVFDDVQAFADRYLDGDTSGVDEGDLDGRVLVGGIAHSGCFVAGDVEVRGTGTDLAFTGTDLDPEEGQVECVRPVVTVALVAVPVGADGPGAEPSSGPADEVPSTVLALEDGFDEAPSIPGPGVARTRAEGAALLGRFGLDPTDEEVLSRLDDGTEVVVAATVGDDCDRPVDAYVVPAATEGLDVVGINPDSPEGLVCDAIYTATAIVALAAEDVPVGTVVEGRSDDLPTGVGEVVFVSDVAPDAEPLAAALAPGVLAGVPGAPDLDLAAPAEGAERLVFVVPACAGAAAELVADVDAGTVTAVVHQDEAPAVDCDALTPYLVVADLAADLVDELDPVVG